jgi:hypothetical protein
MTEDPSSMPTPAARRIALAVATAAALIASVAPAASRLDFPLLERVTFLGAALFVVGFALNAIEYRVFSTAESLWRASTVGGAVLQYGATAVVASLLFTPPSAAAASLGGRLAEALAARSAVAWAGAAAVSALAYAAIYVLVGSIAWPLVKPWYLKPSESLPLRVPKGTVIVALQLGRGLVYTVVVFALNAATGLRGAGGMAATFAFLALAGALAPALSAAGWPAFLRLVHAVEIAIQLLLFTVAATGLLFGFGG